MLKSFFLHLLYYFPSSLLLDSKCFTHLGFTHDLPFQNVAGRIRKFKHLDSSTGHPLAWFSCVKILDVAPPPCRASKSVPIKSSAALEEGTCKFIKHLQVAQEEEEEGRAQVGWDFVVRAGRRRVDPRAARRERERRRRRVVTRTYRCYALLPSDSSSSSSSSSSSITRWSTTPPLVDSLSLFCNL